MGSLTSLIMCMGQLLTAQVIITPAQAGSSPSSPPAPAQKERQQTDRSLPWYIILSNPLDLNELWRKIEHPDFVVVKPEQLAEKRAREAPPRSGNSSASAPAVVESVHVSGQVSVDVAKLTVSLAVDVKEAGPVWVPIRLDEQRLTAAREGSQQLFLRMVERGAWQVQLSGRREHRIEVDLRVPVRTDPTRKSLSMAIPEALSTALDLDFAQHASDILVGANEDFGQIDQAAGKGGRLRARLSPRSKLEVSWNNDAGSLAQSPPLLTAKGEIAIEIDAEQMRTRSSWSVTCLRGIATGLELRIDDLDEITEVVLDDQLMRAGSEGARKAGILPIRLAEAWRPGTTKRLVLVTRRPLSKAASSRSAAGRISFAGFPFTNAREQSGEIGITQSPNLWVSATPARGLRRIDPRELPAELRARPATSSAFVFLDQPFQLDLGVESSPPLFRGESRTLFWIESDQARSETVIELQRLRGRLYEVELGVAEGLQVVSVGPAELVELSSVTGETISQQPGDPNKGARKLKILLTALGRDQNKVALRIAGVQRIPPEGSVKLGLLTAPNATSLSATYTLLAERAIVLALEDQAGRLERSSELASQNGGSARDWPWTLPRGEAETPALLLASSGSIDHLPIRVTRHPRTLSLDTVLSARVSPRWVELLQRTTCSIRFGALSSLEIDVPAKLGDRWELLDKEIVERTELSRDQDGTRRYRLIFGRPVLDKATLRFRIRLPLSPALDTQTARDVVLPWISFREGTASPVRVALSLDPQVVLEGTDTAWARTSGEIAAEPLGDGSVFEFTNEESGQPREPFRFKAIALEPVSLPALIVPRLLIKSVVGEDALRTRVWYWVERHGSDFPFSLPAGARWIGARVDGRIAQLVENDTARASYRLRFPDDVGTRPVLVELEYQESSPLGSSTWQPPRLLEGGAVLQSAWEVRVPWNWAVVGVPDGWTDENQWYWDSYVWKRRPSKNATRLGEWVLGPGVASVAIDPFDAASAEDAQRYVFSSVGDPGAMRIRLVSRSWLIAVCSGATLVLGFFAIFARIRFRTVWLVLAVLGLLAAVLLQPSVTFLAFQSAFIGVALFVLGLLIERLLARSRSSGLSVADGSILAARPGAAPVATVGSDDSTAIRVRVPSTTDFVPAAVALEEPKDELQSSTLERT